MSWRAVLTGSRRRLALEIVDRLLAEALEAGPKPGFPGLGFGGAGEALFLAYGQSCGRVSESEMYSHIEAFVESVTYSEMPLGLWDGISGCAWVLELLGLHEPRSCAKVELDEQLLDSVRTGELCYDLYSGLTGIATYALESMTPSAVALLSSIVEELKRLSEPMETGLAWRMRSEFLGTEARAKYPFGFHPTGLAHGVAGPIFILSQIVAAGLDESGQSQYLAEQGYLWLQSFRSPDGTSRFPRIIEGTKVIDGRSTWCHGDLGIAAALIAAGHALDKSDWVAEGIRTARTSYRRNKIDPRVVDSCLCHGAAGNAHIYNRIAQATGDPGCLEAANAWLDATLASAVPGKKSAGLQFYMDLAEPNAPTTQLGWGQMSTLIQGASGVGISLLAATYDVEPTWDRALGCSGW